jgi:hypothetical protein
MAEATGTDDAVEEVENEEATEDSRKRKGRGQNKNRKSLKVNEKIKLCQAILHGRECKYGGACKFSHNKDEFLQLKAADLEGPCPTQAVAGFCKFGLGCRFSTTHVLFEGYRPSRETERNSLDANVMISLRKHKYPFPRTDAFFAANKGMGKEDETDDMLASVIEGAIEGAVGECPAEQPCSVFDGAAHAAATSESAAGLTSEAAMMVPAVEAQPPEPAEPAVVTVAANPAVDTVAAVEFVGAAAPSSAPLDMPVGALGEPEKKKVRLLCSSVLTPDRLLQQAVPRAPDHRGQSALPSHLCRPWLRHHLWRNGHGIEPATGTTTTPRWLPVPASMCPSPPLPFSQPTDSPSPSLSPRTHARDTSRSGPCCADTRARRSSVSRYLASGILSHHCPHQLP